MMKRTNIKYIAYILLILLINHECIAIANTIDHQVSMKKQLIKTTDGKKYGSIKKSE